MFFERIMSDALEGHDRKVSIDGRNNSNLRVADDIDSLAEEVQEQEALVQRLNKNCTKYKMKIRPENGTRREIKVNGQKQGTKKLQVPRSSCFS